MVQRQVSPPRCSPKTQRGKDAILQMLDRDLDEAEAFGRPRFRAAWSFEIPELVSINGLVERATILWWAEKLQGVTCFDQYRCPLGQFCCTPQVFEPIHCIFDGSFSTQKCCPSWFMLPCFLFFGCPQGVQAEPTQFQVLSRCCGLFIFPCCFGCFPVFMLGLPAFAGVLAKICSWSHGVIFTCLGVDAAIVFKRPWYGHTSARSSIKWQWGVICWTWTDCTRFSRAGRDAALSGDLQPENVFGRVDEVAYTELIELLYSCWKGLFETLCLLGFILLLGLQVFHGIPVCLSLQQHPSFSRNAGVACLAFESGSWP